MSADEPIYLKAIQSIAEISAEQWDACANPGGDIPSNPFTRHAFLLALETSGSATAEQGWQPFHAVLQQGPLPKDDASEPAIDDSEHRTIGVVPMYVKYHSQGEYVFDAGWADALQRAGGDYYPKLQASVPFTPATGRRLLARPDADQSDVEMHLLQGCTQLADKLGVSSLHFTFMPKSQWELASNHGLLQRMDTQFHWHNPGYETFDDFLADLSSKKRKNLKRERRDAVANDIQIELVSGDELQEHHWDAFYQFYSDTGARKWGNPYLTREFFSEIGRTMPEDILLILARRDGRYIAGAINFIGGDALYGRNWGCIEDHRFLHFEICYYQAIDFAIEHKLARVEAGAQGSHKVARGYLPEATYSAHWIRDPGFRDAVANYLEREREHVAADIEWTDGHTPFKKTLDLATVRAPRLVDTNPGDGDP